MINFSEYCENFGEISWTALLSAPYLQYLPVDGDVHHVADKLEVHHGADGRSEGGADCFSLTIENISFQNQMYVCCGKCHKMYVASMLVRCW